MKRFYPAVLERDANGVFAVWFPDFPGCVAAAETQEAAIAKAHDALALAIEDVDAAPEPTAFEAIQTPEDSEVVSLLAVGVTPPDVSERVNVYLPKSLIERLDRQAASMGMSRSSFVGYAVSTALGGPREWVGVLGKRRIRSR